MLSTPRHLKTWQETRVRREAKIMKETFRGSKCQRYHYFSISFDETLFAGLVSHSHLDPEVKQSLQSEFVIGRKLGDEDGEREKKTPTFFCTLIKAWPRVGK